MTSDLDLLRQFTRENSQAAFGEIVRRHLNLVYSAALRQVRSPQLAEEIAQSVFADLALVAATPSSPKILTPWLYTVTRRTAIDVIRKESRRQLREQIAVEMTNMNATESSAGVSPAWSEIEKFLDEAMAALDETDRSAVLLRYFENKSLREVGAALGTSDDAAQKRVGRAVDRLRELFSKQNVTIGASGLVILISANAVQSAPVSLAATISTAVFAGTTIAASTAIATTKIIAMTALQKTIIGTALIAAIGTGIFEAHQASQLRDQVQTLQQQQAPLAEQIRQLQQERDEATNRLAELWTENEQLKSDQNEAELLKLRGEVTQLQGQANDPMEKAVTTVATRVKLLEQYLEQNPNRKIPEIQFLSEKDWADAVWNTGLKTDDDYREALSKLRETAENVFLDEMMKAAFKKYLAANNNILPTNLSELKPYFEVPVTDAMLERYKLLQSRKSDDSKDLVKLVAYADEEYDSNHGMSINGAWGGRFNRVSGIVQSAAQAEAQDNNGQMPTNSAQVMPYLKSRIESVTVQKYLNQIATGTAANPGP